MFWENFVRLCNERGEKPNPVAKKLSISSGAVTFWKKGKVPHHTTLLKIADYFGVSVDYLLDNDTVDSLTAQEKTLLETFRKTTEEGRQRMIQSVLNIYDELK